MIVYKKKNVQIVLQSFDSRFTGVLVGVAIFVMVIYRQAANTVAVAERQIYVYFKFKLSTFQ